MEIIQNIVEYYDELYPVTDAQKKFYENLITSYEQPTKFLRIGCGTGMLESMLANQGCDVTGLETFRELLDSANRRRRTQLISIRFFQMSSLEMARFLGKGFYNVISCLDDRVELIHDPILLRKFFVDCKTLLSDDGVVILQLCNFEKYGSQDTVELPMRQSIRAELSQKITTAGDGEKYLHEQICTGNGKMLPVFEDVHIYPLTQLKIIELAQEAKFKSVEFFADYEGTPYTEDCDSVVAILHV